MTATQARVSTETLSFFMRSLGAIFIRVCRSPQNDGQTYEGPFDYGNYEERYDFGIAL